MSKRSFKPGIGAGSGEPPSNPPPPKRQPPEREIPENAKRYVDSDHFDYGLEHIPSLIARRNEAQDYGLKMRDERDALQASFNGLLTYEERSIVQDLGVMASRIVAAMGADDNDVNEICGHIHVLQSRVLQQAAARAYPGEFRLHLPREH